MVSLCLSIHSNYLVYKDRLSSRIFNINTSLGYTCISTINTLSRLDASSTKFPQSNKKPYSGIANWRKLIVLYVDVIVVKWRKERRDRNELFD